MSEADLGATADEWFNFDFVLGLGANLLPCVPAAPDVKVLAGSALQGKVGKIPSQFNANGEAHGLKEWSKRQILGNEVALWSQDRRLNLCVRTGPLSGVYAFDIDVDGPLALMVQAALQVGMNLPQDELPVRERSNSLKRLVPFRMEGSCKKRIIKTPHGNIELLADGQQFVAAGSHSSGVRYQWLPSLPEALPILTLDQVNRIWETLTKAYATPESAKVNLIAPAPASKKETLSSSQTSPDAPLPNTSPSLTEISESDWSQLLSALRFLLDKVESNDVWSEIGYALLSLQATRPAEQLWLDFSRKAVGYEPGAPEAWWEAHKNQTPRSDYRHIFSLARERGLPRVADPELFPPVSDVGAEGAGADTGNRSLSLVQPSDTGGSDGPAPPDGSGLISVVPPAPLKPIIQIEDGQFSPIVRRLETILAPYVFIQGPRLARVIEASKIAEIVRTSDAVMLGEANLAWAMTHLGEVCEWKKYKKGPPEGWYDTDPSEKYIGALLKLGGWTHMRLLDAIARAPFVREDGSICDEPGYDYRSRVLYVPNTEYPRIAADPDQRDARGALERIRGVFDQFPWKEPAAESAFLSHILSEAARLAIDRCPMFFYDAPSSGTGKGLLQEMAARIVHGADPALRAWVSDGDEIRKSLYASVLAGDRSLWFDNVPDGHKVRSPELCAFITSSTWKDRKLGESETVGVPNRAVLVASGNNITPVSDLARRSLVVRMDANTEKISARVFKIPQLRRYVMEHRPQLLVDVLTIIKAYHLTNPKPKMPVSLPSFEQWSYFCRDPLIWLGLDDPVITQDHETDDETTHAGAVFVRLVAHFGDNAFTGNDVARVVNGIADANGELANELQTNGCAEPNNPVKVGYWLRGCRDRISSGYKLVRAGRANTAQKWQLVKMHWDLT